MIGKAGLALLALVWALPLRADQAIDRLVEVLHLPQIIEVMRAEGLEYGAELDQVMLGGRGGEGFAAQVERIHDTGQMRAGVAQALRIGMSGQDIARSIAFFETDRGQRLLTLETAARVAMADPAVEEAAWAQYEQLRQDGGDRHGVITEFVQVNDLLERNVDGAMQAQFMFSVGLATGGQADWGREQIADEVRAQQDEIRETTRTWLMGFLTLAYGAVPLDDLEAYVAFSETGAGEALNEALFDAFNRMYVELSFELGLAVGLFVASDEL